MGDINSTSTNNTSEKTSFFKKILNIIKKILSKIPVQKIQNIFWGTKMKKIGTSILIVVCILGYVYLEIKSNYYITSNPYINEAGWFSSVEETAEIMLLIGERTMQNGNYEDALFGNDSIYYLPEEIKGSSIKFSGGLNKLVSDSKMKKTNSAEAANYWIGVCYYKLAELADSPEEKVKKYIEAINYFTKETDSPIFNSFKQSQIGDCYSQLGDWEKALEYYENALNTDNEVIRLEILYKTAETAKILEQNELAIKYYKEIETDFPKSTHANQVNKKIAELLAKE